jgi:hypothetical protein
MILCKIIDNLGESVYFCENILKHALLHHVKNKTYTLFMRLMALFGMLLVCLGATKKTLAQAPQSDSAPLIQLFFEVDTLNIGQGETFSNRLRFENHDHVDHMLLKTKVSSGALLNLPDTIRLAAGESRSYPIKYLASARLVHTALQAFTAVYSFKGQSLPAAVFYTRIDMENRISIQAQEPVVYLQPGNSRVRLRLRLRNNGYSAAQVGLSWNTYPAGLQLSSPTTTSLSLAAAAEQYIELEAADLHNGKLASDYQVTIEAKDPAGRGLATSIVKVVRLDSRKVQRMGTENSGFQTNTTGMDYTNVGNGYAYYSFRANGDLTAPDQTGLRYSVNLNYNNEQSSFDLYETSVSYRTKHFALQAGSVNENLDFPIYGRGVKASLYLNKASSVDVYGIQNNYMLFSSDSQIPGASIYGASYNYNLGLDKSARVNALYSHNPLNGISTYLSSGGAQLKLAENHQLELRGGLSSETGPQGRHPGMASGINYHGRTGNWDIGLNNYYSTAHYSGMQRGVLQLDERVSYTIQPATTVFVRYNRLQNAPAYSGINFSMLSYSNEITTYETGVQVAFAKFHLGLRPYLMEQRLNSSRLNYEGATSLSSASCRVAVDMSYSLGKGQFMVQADYGNTHQRAAAAETTQKGWKLNANFSNRWFSFNTLVQTAAYYLNEVYTYGGNAGKMYAFGPGLHLNGFKERLRVDANHYLNYNGAGGKWSNALTTQVNYRLPGNWTLKGQLGYNSYGNYSGSTNLQTQLGVSKSFTRHTAPGNAKLDLQFFGDENGNGLWDRGEVALAAVVSSLRGVDKTKGVALTTVSGKSGHVSFSNLEKETYTLQVRDAGDRHLREELHIPLARNQRISVPLVRSNWIKGRINLLKEEFIASTTSIEGLRIVATDANNQEFHTFTNEEGEFRMALPLNAYTLTADVDSEKFNVLNDALTINVGRGQTPAIELELKDISRKVMVTQF